MNLLYYSGYAIIFFTWVFLVYPYFLLSKKIKLKTLSDVGSKKGVFGTIFNLGLILVGLSQMFFVSYLATSKGIDFGKASWGGTLFYIGSSFLILESFFTIKRSKSIHLLLAGLYVLFVDTGAFLLTLSFIKIIPIAVTLNLILVLIMGFGSLVLVIAKNNYYSEMFAIIISTFWALIFYAFLL